MIKFLIKTMILVSFFAVLSACDVSDVTPPDDNGLDTDYDPRSLVPESCDYLENIDDWQPVWCDDFDEDGLPNSDRWLYDTGGHGWGNNELQYYTRDRLDNAYVEDGILHIQAIKESFSGRDYTSARLITKYQGDWLYGRIQVKAKMPSGRGLWPAVWMLPTNQQYGQWPGSGEIDIMEYVGYDPGIVHGTIHTGAYNHNIGTQLGYTISVPTVEEEFHVYEMIWEPRRIKLFVDGEQYAIFGYNPDTNIGIKNSDAWPFDDNFHLLLNVAVGGDWGGARGIDDSIFPQTMEVEYVRVYQKDYAGLTEAPPQRIANITIQETSYDSVRFKWAHADADVMVSHYNITVDGEFVGKTTLNAFDVEGLRPATDYVIGVEAVDFADQTSPVRSVAVTTSEVQSIPGLIQAETYDSMLGVNQQPTEDDGGGTHIGGIDTNDFLIYTLEVLESGTYRVLYRVASEEGGGEIALFTRSSSPHATTSIEATGGSQDWVTISSETFTLNEGIYDFKFVANQGGFNLNYFELILVEE